MLDGDAKELAERRNSEKEDNDAEAHLVNAFLNCYNILPKCLASKKKKVYPNVPSRFHEACQYPGS